MLRFYPNSPWKGCKNQYNVNIFIELDDFQTYTCIWLCFFCCSSVTKSCLILCDPWTASHQVSLSFAVSWSLLKLMFIELVMPSNHLILCHPISSCSQSFPASRSFPISQFFTSDGQIIGTSASASVLSMNIQSWFPLGLTGLVSLLSKGLSRVFSSTAVWKYQFFSIQPSLWSNSHICTWQKRFWSFPKSWFEKYCKWIYFLYFILLPFKIFSFYKLTLYI